MDSVYPIVVIMLVCWTIAGYVIWKWGPGMRRRSVQCPEKKLSAKVLAEQVEGDFSCLRVVDVKSCSLVAGEILTCDRSCLRYL
jgi:hypothetical protein